MHKEMEHFTAAIFCVTGFLLFSTGGSALKCYLSVGIRARDSEMSVTCEPDEVCYRHTTNYSSAETVTFERYDIEVVTKGCMLTEKPMGCTVVGNTEECYCRDRDLCNGGISTTGTPGSTSTQTSVCRVCNGSSQISLSAVLVVLVIGLRVIWEQRPS